MTVEDDGRSRWSLLRQHLDLRSWSAPTANAAAPSAVTARSRFLRFRVMILATLAVFLVWEVITRSIAAYLADANPEAAIRLRSTNPTALLNLADMKLNPAAEVVEPALTTPQGKTNAPSNDDTRQPNSDSDTAPSTQDLDLGDRSPTPSAERGITGSAKVDSEASDQIRSWAELALLNDPLNARALRILGQLAQRTSDVGRTHALMQAAARRSLHESFAIYWILRKSYEDGDYHAALHYADTLLRTNWQALAPLMPMFAKLAETPEASDELKQLLARNPWWRPDFFKQLPYSISDARTPLDIFLTLRNSPTPPTAADLSSYLNFLVQHGFYELAYYTWLQFLPDEQLGNAGRLYNGSFEVAPSGLPFDWVFSQGGGVAIKVATRPDQSRGHALFMEFGPGRVDFGGVRQLVLLAPGSYHFQGKYQVDLASQRGLQWRVICAGGATTLIGASPTVNGSDLTWKDFEFSFTVPETDCPAQYVQLVLDARSASETFISGSIWYGDLSITRDSGPKQNPE